MCYICNGYSGCPVCNLKVEEIECDNCSGTGRIYFDEKGDTKGDTVEANSILVYSETCEKCGGVGYFDRFGDKIY